MLIDEFHLYFNHSWPQMDFKMIRNEIEPHQKLDVKFEIKFEQQYEIGAEDKFILWLKFSEALYLIKDITVTFEQGEKVFNDVKDS